MPYRTEKVPCSNCGETGSVRHGYDPDDREVLWECPQCDGTGKIEIEVWVNEPAGVTSPQPDNDTRRVDTAYVDAKKLYADALDALRQPPMPEVQAPPLPEVPPLEPPITGSPALMPKDSLPTQTIGIEVERPARPDRLIFLPDGIEARLSVDKERAVLQWGYDRAESDTYCYKLSYRALAAASPEGAARLLGRDHRIQIATGATQGHIDVIIDREQAREAVQYIKRAIDHGRPVIIGVNVRGDVNVRGKPGYNEGITDHFLIAIGYVKRGGQVVGVTAVDNATGQASRFQFTVNPDTGRIATTGRPNTGLLVANHDYQVTQVRRFSDI